MRNLVIAIVGSVFIIVMGSSILKTQPLEKGQPKLKVSDNQRYLVDENGNPFFWLGDTGWLLFSKLNREEADQYLTDRAEKGFNVVQVMVLHSLNVKNYYGDSALIGQNVSHPLVTNGNAFEDTTQYDYWDNVDYVVDKGAEKGIYIGLVPVWGSNVKSGKVSKTNAIKYALWLANRYKSKWNIVWLNGGDIMGSDSLETWNAIGNTINVPRVAIKKSYFVPFSPEIND